MQHEVDIALLVGRNATRIDPDVFVTTHNHRKGFALVVCPARGAGGKPKRSSHGEQDRDQLHCLALRIIGFGGNTAVLFL